jgi:hypothetical protein
VTIATNAVAIQPRDSLSIIEATGMSRFRIRSSPWFQPLARRAQSYS